MTNLKLILRTYSALRQMSPDDITLLETLRGLNDGDRELMVETLQGKATAKKAGKKSSTSKSSQSSSKSPRASGMAAQLGQRRKRGPSDGSVNTEGLCAFQYHDETFCDEPYLNQIHAADGGYAGYHPFQPSTTAPPAPAPSPANGGAGSTTRNSEASTVSAQAATAGLSSED